jgi:hypothetical protein
MARYETVAYFMYFAFKVFISGDVKVKVLKPLSPLILQNLRVNQGRRNSVENIFIRATLWPTHWIDPSAALLFPHIESQSLKPSISTECRLHKLLIFEKWYLVVFRMHRNSTFFTLIFIFISLYFFFISSFPTYTKIFWYKKTIKQ